MSGLISIVLWIIIIAAVSGVLKRKSSGGSGDQNPIITKRRRRPRLIRLPRRHSLGCGKCNPGQHRYIREQPIIQRVRYPIKADMRVLKIQPIPPHRKRAPKRICQQPTISDRRPIWTRRITARKSSRNSGAPDGRPADSPPQKGSMKGTACLRECAGWPVPIAVPIICFLREAGKSIPATFAGKNWSKHPAVRRVSRHGCR